MSRKVTPENTQKFLLTARDLLPGVLQNFSMFFTRKGKKPDISEATSMESSFPPAYRTLPHPRFASLLANPVLSPQGRTELIELSNLGMVELSAEHRGKGHVFETVQLDAPTWCDRCGGFIWSLYQPVECKNCHLTCHEHCRDLILVNCPLSSESNSPNNATLKAIDDSTYCIKRNGSTVKDVIVERMSKKELQALVERCNVKSAANQLTLSEDGRRVEGFVRVCMNLMRPINVVAGTRPASIYDIIKGEMEDEGTAQTLTSFYLPVDTVKALHIDSSFDTGRVIAVLLRKFKVADAPAKYALYESWFDDSTQQCVLRKLSNDEKPLCLLISWIEAGQAAEKRFVLQENDNCDISWDEFALPELDNFLKILEREEQEYVNQICYRYEILREKIEEQLEMLQLQPPPDDL